jgi:hypothetical protein
MDIKTESVTPLDARGRGISFDLMVGGIDKDPVGLPGLGIFQSDRGGDL